MNIVVKFCIIVACNSQQTAQWCPFPLLPLYKATQWLNPVCDFFDKVIISLPLFTLLVFSLMLLLDASVQFSSVPQSCPTLCDPHRLQHARPPCPSPTPGVYSNSCQLSWWCHPTTSTSAVPFFSHLQSFPVSVFSTSGGKYWSSSHQVAKVLEFQLQHQSFQLIFRTDFP